MPVQVQGPDGNTYQFPDGTDKAAAVAYFKKKGIGVQQQMPEDNPPGVPGIAKPDLNYVPALDNPKNLLSGFMQGAKNAIQHPIDSFISGPGQSVVASGTGAYPSVASVGQNRDAANNAVQQDALKQQGKQGNFAAAHPFQTAGNAAGQAAVVAGLTKGVPKVAGLVTDAVGKGVQLASTTPQAVKLSATRFFVPGTPGELLQSALKPGVKYGPGAGQMLEQSLPDILAQDPNVNGVSGFARASDAAKDAAYQPYNNLVAPYRPAPGGIGPVRPGTVDGTPTANALNSSIPAINRFESANQIGPSSDWTATRPNTASGIIQRTAERANLYRRQIPVATSDALREDANAKLNAFYAKTGGDQNAALSNPETAAVKAIGDTQRQQLYPKLESDYNLQPGTVAGMQQKYGRLADISDIANHREPVFARHDPVSLSQKIVTGHGNPLSMAWNYGVQKVMGDLTDSDALVNSAVDRYKNPQGTPLPARAGVFPQASSAIGRVLSGVGQGAKSMRFSPPAYFYAARPPQQNQ